MTLTTYYRQFDQDFNRLFSQLIYDFEPTNYPPMNKGVIGEQPFIEIALTGFKKEDVEVTFNKRDRKLIVKATSQKDENKKYHPKMHKIAQRNFTQEIYVGNIYEVDSVTLENGLLHIRFKESEEAKEQLEIINIS